MLHFLGREVTSGVKRLSPEIHVCSYYHCPYPFRQPGPSWLTASWLSLAESGGTRGLRCVTGFVWLPSTRAGQVRQGTMWGVCEPAGSLQLVRLAALQQRYMLRLVADF